jgi:hypothetical protein
LFSFFFSRSYRCLALLFGKEKEKCSDSNEARRAIERQPEEESPLYAEVISFLLSKKHGERTGKEEDEEKEGEKMYRVK